MSTLEPSDALSAPDDLETSFAAPAGLYGREVARLSDRTRVIEEEMQWVVQRRQGRYWRGVSFCVTKDALLRCIREQCSDADISQVLLLPDWHPDRQ
jgi:hypothetical protein